MRDTQRFIASSCGGVLSAIMADETSEGRLIYAPLKYPSASPGHSSLLHLQLMDCWLFAPSEKIGTVSVVVIAIITIVAILGMPTEGHRLFIFFSRKHFLSPMSRAQPNPCIYCE